jgi:hypothetical protein
MSETTEPDGKPPTGSPAPEPEPTPTPGTGPSGAPEPTPAETDEPAPAKEADEERESRGDKRFAVVTAQRAALQRERDALRAENEFYRRQLAGQAPEQDTPEQAQQRLRMQVRAEVEAEIKIKNLHAEGYTQYADWDDRRNRVVNMGGDAEFANLIIDMPPREAVRVVAALAEDPEALMRIVDLKGERQRAVALGKYAATIEDAQAQRSNGHAPPQVTRAPAPIRPVTGRAAPQFNEYTADGQTLVDRYMKQNLEQQRR